MKRHLFLAAYLGLWATIAALVVYFGRVIGLQWWLAALVAYLLFFVVNGSMAYVSVKRRLEAEGIRPPSYLAYLFFPMRLQQSVAVPRVLRIFIGIVIFLGGAAFIAVSIILGLDFTARVRPVGAAGVVIVMAVLGATFVYVGIRLMVVRADESLFNRLRNKRR